MILGEGRTGPLIGGRAPNGFQIVVGPPCDPGHEAFRINIFPLGQGSPTLTHFFLSYVCFGFVWSLNKYSLRHGP